MPRPIGLDLFAGVGGLSLGFEQAGFDVVAAVEIDPIHCAVHKYNFPYCTVLPRSVAGLTGVEIREQTGIGQARVDVVFGGAPCQGFSMMGQRALDDPRNGLVREFVRIVTEIQPSYFVFENVKGLTLGRHSSFLHELIDEFQQNGYQVRLPWKVLDAASFGVPQHRERLILMGSRIGVPLPEYPVPQFCAADTYCPTALKHGPTCHDALGDLPDAEEFEELLEADETPTTAFGPPSAYARSLRGLGKDAWHYGYKRRWDSAMLTSSRRSDHTEISRRRFASTRPGDVVAVARFYKLSADGLSNTLRAGTDSARGAFTSPRPIHYAHARCVTVREMARLHGFPDWFRLHGTKWHGARQIGNAVPPALGRAVAQQIIEALGVLPQRPTGTIRLGETKLVHMDMSEASRHFDIEIPIQRRDRKSGLKKRRQEDIERGGCPVATGL
jgi:DNA (cytosine-5)-methyltransferase 1